MPHLEELESRNLLSITPAFLGVASLTVGTDVNVSKAPFNQTEVHIAVNPMDPGNVVVLSNGGFGAAGTALRSSEFTAYSQDAGAKWNVVPITMTQDGRNSSDRFDGAAAVDDFGNIHIVYMRRPPGGGNNDIMYARSTDGGASYTDFRRLANGVDVDKPWVATGPDAANPGNQAVWVTYTNSSLAGNQRIFATGATVAGLGNVAAFPAAVQVNDGAAQNNYSAPAVGPNGELVVTWMSPSSGQGPANIRFDRDLNGLAGGITMGADTTITATNAGGFDFIPATPERSTFASPYLMYDRSGGAFNGRLYVAYADETPNESGDFDIFVRSSNDDGVNWGAPVLVNNDGGTNSQFFQNMSVDQTTGAVWLSWYDARNDTGLPGSIDDGNGNPNTEVQYFATVSLDGGATFLPNILVSDGASDEDRGDPDTNDFGDYTGIAAYGGVAYATWADNSNSTNDLAGSTPASNRFPFEVYVDRINLNWAGGQTVTLTGGGSTDVWLIRPDESKTFLQFFENSAATGKPAYTTRLASVGSIVVNAGGGDDQILIESLGPAFTGTITVDGGIGNDLLFDLHGIPAGNLSSIEAISRATVTATAQPEWLEQGPGPIQGGLVAGITNKPVAGAIETVLLDPNRPLTMYVGSVNGGVWRTRDGGTSWEPLTDNFPSLSISALTFDQADATKKTIYAATGRVSSWYNIGSAVGLMKGVEASDGTISWTLIRRAEFENVPIHGLYVNGTTWLVATRNGLYRSTDGGASFEHITGVKLATAAIAVAGAGYTAGDIVTVTGGTEPAKVRIDTVAAGVPTGVTLLNGGVYSAEPAGAQATNGGHGAGLTLNVTFTPAASTLPSGLGRFEMVVDPGDSNRVFVSVPGSGVYRSTNAGATFTPVNTGLDLTGVLRIRLGISEAVDTDTGQRPVYAGVVRIGRATLSQAENQGTKTIHLNSVAEFDSDDEVTFQFGTATAEQHKITSIDRAAKTITLAEGLNVALAMGAVVQAIKSDGNGGKERISNIYRSEDSGNNWLALGPPGDADGGIHPGGQAVTHFSLVPDKTDPNVLFVGGDRQQKKDGNWPNTAGATNFTGRLFRGVLAGAVTTWSPVTDGGADPDGVGTLAVGTGPHADSRNMVFDADGNIIEVDDGGIYRLLNPNLATADPRQWTSLHGNLRLTEFTSVAYDSVNDVIIGGAQDNGVARQDGPNNYTWTHLIQGDGQIVQSGTVDGKSVKYGSSQSLIEFKAFTDLSDSGDARDLEVNGTGIFDDDELSIFDNTLAFTTQWVLNQINPSLLMIGTSYLYEEDPDFLIGGDPGDDVSLQNGSPVWSGFFHWKPDPNAKVGPVLALAYGGRERNASDALVDKPRVAYAAVKGTVGTGTAATQVGELLLRRDSGQSFLEIPSWRTGTPNGALIRDLVLQPDNWRKLYVVDVNNKVWMGIKNAGSTNDFDYLWTDITGNLGEVAGLATGSRDDNLYTVEVVVDPGPTSASSDDQNILLVGGRGGVFRSIAPSATGHWSELGRGMPNTIVTDLHYDTTDDVLLAGTLGRGAFTIHPALAAIKTPSSLSIKGTSADDVLHLVVRQNQPWMMDLFAYNVGGSEPALPVRSFDLTGIDTLSIDGLGGGDKIILDAQKGVPFFPGGISIADTGGAGADTLDFDNPASTTLSGLPAGGPFTGADWRGKDGFGEQRVSRVTFTGIESVPDLGVVPAAPIPAVANALQGLGAVFGDLLGRSLRGEPLPFVNSASLNNTFGGRVLEVPDPLSLPRRLSTSQVRPEGLTQINDGNSIFDRILSTSLESLNLQALAADASSAGELAALLDALDDVDGNVTFSEVGGVTTFQVGVEKHLAGIAGIKLDGSAVLDAVSISDGKLTLEGQAEIGFDAKLALTFGIDASGFFIEPNASDPELSVTNITLDGSALKAEGNYGFLGVEVSGATVTFDPNLGLNFKFQELASEPADGKIRLTEITDLTASGRVDFRVDSPGTQDLEIEANLKVLPVLPGLGSIFPISDTQVTITWADLETSTPTATTSTDAGQGGVDFKNFLNLDPTQLLAQFHTFTAKMGDLAANIELDVPFLSVGFDGVVDLVDTIEKRIVSRLFADTGDPTSSIPSFTTIQGLVTALSSSLNDINADKLIDLANLPDFVTYDAATKSVLFNVDFEKEFDLTKPLDLGFDLAEGFADFNFSSDASITATLVANLTIGLDLKAAFDGESPTEWLFLGTDSSLNVALSVSAENIQGSARLGFLDVQIVNGDAEANANLTVTLVDPGVGPENDQRITIGELGAALLANPTSLIGAALAGSATAHLPLAADFLGIAASAETTVSIDLVDITDPDTWIITPPDFPSMDEMLNFDHIDAASIVGLLGQLTFWLDQFRNSDQFANFDIPLVGPALDKVLGFADSFRDRLLIDDADDGLDGANTLVFDINAAIEEAGLSDQLRAEIAGGKIKLIANDAAITSISVSAAAELGFTGSESSSGTPFESIVATGAAPANGKLVDDAVLNISINGATAIPVTITSASANNNVALGNDRWKLVNPSNAATFHTVGQMVLKVAEILGVPDALTYNPDDDTLTFTLNLSELFGQIDRPIDLGLDNLPEFLTLETNGVIRLSADGSLNLTLGVYLGDAPSSSMLDGNELLTVLNGGIDIETALRITGANEVRTVYGQLSGDAKFKLALDAAPAVEIVVTKAATSDNTTAADLVADINAALAAQSLDSEVVAVADELRIKLQKAVTATFTALKLTSSNSDPAVKDIGFASSQDGAIGPMKVVAASALPTNGQLSADAHFSLSLDGALPVAVTVTKASTTTNTTASQLVTDVNTALAAAGLASQIVAVLDNDRLRLQESTPGTLSSLALTATGGDPAVTQLGFGTSQAGSAGSLEISATKDLVALRGRLTSDAAFNVSLNTVNGGTPIAVTVLAAATATNRYAFDIVSDVQAALDAIPALDDKIRVDFSNGRLIFVAKDGATSFTITAAGGNTAVTQLGLATNNIGNSVDFTISVRDGSGVYGITLDGLTMLSEVITQIGIQTFGKVTAAISNSGVGLTLTDNSIPAGGNSFAVQLANNSTAAIDLGILRTDVQGDEAADGVIEGADIGGLTPLDRFFIENASASIGVHLSTPTLDANGNVLNPDGNGVPDDGLSGTAKFGFVGINLAGGGTVDATLSLGLKDPGTTAADGRISLTELLGALGDLDTLIDAPALTGSGSILFDVDVNPALPGLSIDPNAQIGILIHDLGDPFSGEAPDIEFVYPNLDNLLDFGNTEFNFENVIAGLRALADFLGQFEAFDFLSKPLPLVGVSVNDLIDVADRFGTAITDAQANPAGTVQFLERKLEEAFGLPPMSPLIDLMLVHDDNDTLDTSDDFDILKIELSVSAGFSDTLGVDFDLGLPIDLGGGADLSAAGTLSLDLDIGFRVDDPTQIFVFDSTGLDGTLTIDGDNLTFRAAVGPMGVFINGGTADIHGTLGGNKFFEAGLQNATFVNNRVLLGDLDLSTDFSAQIGGAVAVMLPVYFPTDSNRAGTVFFDANLTYDSDSGDFNASANPRAEDEGGNPIELAELFAFDPSEMSLLDQLLLGVDGVDLFLEGLQDILDGEIGGVSLPLIGDKLAGAADVIGDFRNGFVEDFRQAIEELANPTVAFNEAVSADPISTILFDLLGPGGLNLLLDSDDAGTDVTVADIRYRTNISTPGVALEDTFLDWDFKLGSTLLNAGAGIGFDVGIPGLGLETKGEINLTIAWELAFGFGMNYDDGFYLDIGDDADELGDDDVELQLDVDLTVPGGGITGTLGFLQLSAEDDTDDGDGLYTHLGATFGIDIFNKSVPSDTKLGFSELGKISIDAKIAAEAVVDLGMVLSLSSDLLPSAPTNFPSIVADFTLEWAVGNRNAGELISLGDLDGSFLKNGLQFVGFENVGLDLGSYLTDLIGPIANTITDITAPIKPFLDFLTEPIPVISDLAGPTSLLDIASMSGVVNPGIIVAIEVIDQVVEIANMISSLPGGNAVLYFDGFLDSLVIYEAPTSGPVSGIDLTDPNLDLEALSDQLLANLDFLPEELQDALGGVAAGLSGAVSKMLPGGTASSGFSLPIIEDPSQIFGMLMGQPAILVQYDMAALELDAEFSAFFSIFGPLGVSINAEFAAQFGPFQFGYDTFGITQFAASDFRNPLLLFDGFFVGDLDAKGNDVPELQFDAGLWAAAELNLAIARGGVGGGLFAEIDMDLHDPDRDGRVRIKEIVTNVLNEFKYGEPALSPLAMFDITGKLTAELFAFLKIDIPLFPVDEKFLITEPITLLDFESNFERQPTLATELGDGVLQLNMGKFADQRIEGDLSDLPEEFHVKQDGSGHVLVWAPSLGVDFSEAQEYEVSKLILALGGEGDDIIDLSGVTDNLKYELEGNVGNDTIKVGSGNGAARILGGSGNDDLWGGGGDDTIFGEAGDDTIHGGSGKDWLFGDGSVKDSIQGNVITVSAKLSDGNDTIYGDNDDDLIFGAGGGDTLEGGGGNDVLIGDGGKVTVGSDRLVVTKRSLLMPPEADPGRLELAVDDTSKGNHGAKDTLRGDAGNDHLYGGVGDDDLFGGANDDVIYGETGHDAINAGDDNDIVFGDFGTFVLINAALEPTVMPGGEADTIEGGLGNDKLLGGAGNDLIHGDKSDGTGTGNDWIWGGTGVDLIYGDGGADQLYGNADPDKLYGDAGDDYLEGGGGNDMVFGGAGEDILVAGYGSDTMDGGADGDTYRISVRGGSTTELTTAYDTGTTGVDSLVVVGTPGDDTLLLRAMADSYFPTLPKLQGLVQKYFNSTLADRLAAMLQSFNDAYGPWELPPGLVEALTTEYQDGLLPALYDAVDDNRTGHVNEPSEATLKALIDEVLASNAASKIEAMQKAITAEYAKANNGAGVPVPNTLFSALTAAYRPALNYSNPAQVAAFVNGLNAAIAPYYVSESMYPREAGLAAIVDQVHSEYPAKLALQAIVDQVHSEYPAKLDLQAIVDQVYADTDVEVADRFDAIESRIVVVYGDFAVQRASMLEALQDAWDALPGGATETEQTTALKDAISDAYDDDAEEAAGAKFDATKSRIAFSYGAPFADQRSNMLDALQAAWDDLLASPTPPTESEIIAALKDAISDTFDDDAEEAAGAKFDTIKSRIEAAFVDRRDVNSAFTEDEFEPQRTAMLAALQDAWDNLPDGASEAQQKSALKDAIDDTYTADPIGNPEIISDDTVEDFLNTAFVAVINEGGKFVERFNYRQMEGLVVSTLGGADYVVLDDLLAAATINLGDGNDRVQVGQVFRSERVKDPEGELITGITAEDVFTTIEITRGWLSNGVSVPTTINGGEGDDNFTVFRNVAVLNLNGGNGDDVFTVRAFALKGSTDNERARTDMKGDGGADTILYVVNAPVGIDGGDGFDTVRIVGTEFGDDFVVTDSGIFGAGLNVSYVNIERLVADGAEGDDRFFVQSTGLEVVTEIDGGLGSDTFFVGGNPSRAPVAVVSNDLRGHSGIILHSVESDDTNWNGLHVEGLSANVGDNEEAMILLSESGGRTLVVEGASGAMLGVTDTYRLRLSRAPLLGTIVAIAVVPAGLPPEDEAKNYADLEVWDPDYINPDTLANEPSWRPSRTIKLDGTNWDTGIEIEIRAKQDVGYEGRRFTFINHKITEETTDVTFQEAQTRSLKVQMEDDDRDGIIVVPSGLGNTVLEGGFNDTFDVVLTHQPKTPAGDDTVVTVTLSLAGAPGQIRLSDDNETNQETITLTFTSANWNVVQTVTVSAANDDTVEGFHTEYIRFDVSSADVDVTKGPFVDGQVVTVNGEDIIATTIDGKVWLQIDGDIDDPDELNIPDSKPSTYVLLPHRPIPGTVVVRVAGQILSPGDPDDPDDPNDPVAPPRYSVTGNTITFLSPSGAPEFLTGKVEVNYQYMEFGYNGLGVRDQVVDIYDNDTPTVIILPSGDGMIDVVEGDLLATDTYTVRLASQPTGDVFVVIDSVKTRTTWGANAYYENQLLLSDDGDDGIDGNADDETDLQQITLKFTSANWNVEQIVTVRAYDDDRLDGNDTQVFAPDLQTVNKIRGPLIIEGAAGAGSLTLPTPLMMPWELNIRPSDGNVVGFQAATMPAEAETMTVELADLQAVVDRFKEDDPTFTLARLVGKTLEMSKGAGTDVVLDPSRPDDKFDRFWLIVALVEVTDEAPGDPQLVTLTLQNPTAVDPTQPNVTAPDSSSEYAITSLSVNFFADEREQIDYLFVYDDDSVADDTGSLTSADGVVRGFDSLTSTMVVDTSALQAVAELLGVQELQQLEGLKLTITVGPGTGHVYMIDEVSEVEGETKELTLTSLSGSDVPTDRSEFRIEGSDRYGRITGFGMGPNILFAGRPQGGGITYGDLEVVQVELGLGDDTVRVDYATNAEDHATKRTGDFYTLTILNTGGGIDEVTVALDNGDSTEDYDSSLGDGAFALNTGEGDDKVFGAASTRQLIVFGGAGQDEIHTGSGDDIVFGDVGRVDYTKKIDVDGVEYDAVVTRLGSSVPQNPNNPHVTFATDTTISDSAILGTDYEFPVDYEGLVGLSVQVISPEGHVQFRTVIANTADTITVDAPWTEFPVFDAVDPNDNYYYRLSSYPDDQTDGLFRGPRVIWSVKDTIGDDDTIDAGGGSDTVIGGVGMDMLHGGAGDDWIAGDNARFEFAPVSEDGAPTQLTLVQTTSEAFGDNDLIFGDADRDILIGGTEDDTLDGGGQSDIVLGDQGTIHLVDGKIVSVEDPGTDGDDILIGGDDPDLLIGGLGADTISGFGDADILIGDAAEVQYAEDGITIVRIETLDRDNINNGIDTIYGGADDDIVIGGSNSDNLDGGAGRDLVFGDNVLLENNAGSGNAIDPRFRALTGATIYSLNGLAQVGGEFGEAIQPVPGGRPSWADWTITLDQSPNAANFGDDYIAGGAGNDEIFGQLGDDTIQGDGSIASRVDDIPGTLPVGAARIGGLLAVIPSFEDPGDGDDYIEGNGGNDVIFGNLGQDDIIGGSSNLFSLTTPTLRPDGSDLIFGGAGTDIARNDLGDTTASGHARDADMILADNGNIYRLVGTNGNNSGSYLTFNYDTYNTLRIVPRAAQLLDYTPGGPDFDAAAANDLGASDELHGESGDDFIYGMKGADVLFGEGQDDDLIGGYGNDWISGGTGDDGVLGDDGRIMTSRNGAVEPLNDVTTATVQTNISTPGNLQTATIYVGGQLNKAANLTPFSVDPTWPQANTTDEFAGTVVPHNSDDIIYGGWGNDFLHGGSGDDAVSGAEALAAADANANPNINYDRPTNPGDVLGYGDLRAGEFAAYDEFEPLKRVGNFLLNFSAAEGPLVPGSAIIRTDGDDRIFGDTGNDWIVGGTGKDNIYGGWGDDLLNADDDQSTNSGANDATDTHSTYEDRAYGGAGRDVLIGNTGGDRLIDWVGEFNSYLVPFAPYGVAAISRTLQPQLPEFLYALSRSDGADPTRVADTGADPLRNGEPVGELGLVLQQDFSWKTQTGAPDDPQAGNIPGGPRDVLRAASFNDGQAQGFVPDSGTWTVTAGRYQVAPTVSGGDAVSVFYVDNYVPSYFEMLATINAVKPTGGTNANAYLIFDYQSQTNFKFAGVNVSTNKLEIGHRNAQGWIVDKQAAYVGAIKSGTDYNMFLAINGTIVTLTVNNRVTMNFTFGTRVDVYGISHGLNDGMVGLGAKNAKAQIDNVTVQRVAPITTFNTTVDFSSGITSLFQAPQSGTWTLASGRYAGAPTATTPAINLTTLQVSASALVDLSTTFKTTGEGGLVYDYYGTSDFKFVTISATTHQIFMGHRTAKGWFTDAVYNNASLVAGTNYTLGLQLKGTTASVTLNGQTVVSRVYNALVTDGGNGLLSRIGTSSFDAITVKTDDAAFATTTAAILTADPAAMVAGPSLQSADPMIDALGTGMQLLGLALNLDDQAAAPEKLATSGEDGALLLANDPAAKGFQYFVISNAPIKLDLNDSRAAHVDRVFESRQSDFETSSHTRLPQNQPLAKVLDEQGLDSVYEKLDDFDEDDSTSLDDELVDLLAQV